MDINKINWESLKEDTEVCLDNEHQYAMCGSLYSGDNIGSLEEDLQFISTKNAEALMKKYGEDFFNDFLN